MSSRAFLTDAAFLTTDAAMVCENAKMALMRLTAVRLVIGWSLIYWLTDWLIEMDVMLTPANQLFGYGTLTNPGLKVAIFQWLAQSATQAAPTEMNVGTCSWLEEAWVLRFSRKSLLCFVSSEEMKDVWSLKKNRIEICGSNGIYFCLFVCLLKSSSRN
jgi:hypothetical protein